MNIEENKWPEFDKIGLQITEEWNILKEVFDKWYDAYSKTIQNANYSFGLTCYILGRTSRNEEVELLNKKCDELKNKFVITKEIRSKLLSGLDLPYCLRELPDDDGTIKIDGIKITSDQLRAIAFSLDEYNNR